MSANPVYLHQAIPRAELHATAARIAAGRCAEAGCPTRRRAADAYCTRHARRTDGMAARRLLERRRVVG